MKKVLFLMSAMLVLTLGSCSNKKQLSELQSQEVVLQKNYDNGSVISLKSYQNDDGELISIESYQDASTALITNYYMQLELTDNVFDKEAIQRKIDLFEKTDSLKNEHFLSRTKISKY
jgi:uncharacterized protein YcfL